MAAPIILEANSKIRYIASLRTKDPDMRFFTVIVEHEPTRWEINQVVHITAEDVKEIHKKIYPSKEEIMKDFHLFRDKATNEMNESKIEFAYDEYPVADKPQEQQIEYLNLEFGKEMGFIFDDKGKKL